MKPLALGATVVAVLALLTGCFFGGGSGAGTGSGGTSGNGQSGSDSGSGTSTDDGGTSTTPPGDVSIDSFEGLPSGFPTSEVPLVAGDIPFGVDLGTGWTVIVQVDDLGAAFADASDKLKGAGFTAQVESITSQGSVGVYLNDSYQVNLTASENADYGLSLTYVVVKLG